MDHDQQLHLIASFLVDPTMSYGEKRAAIGIVLTPPSPSNEQVQVIGEVVDRALSDGAAFDPSIPYDADESLMRAQYIVESYTRRAAASTSPEAEDAYFISHLEVSGQRQLAMAREDEMVATYGPVLSWVHLGTATTHRPDHVAADGKNYNAVTGARTVEGGKPGIAPRCDCVPGPPRQGATLLP